MAIELINPSGLPQIDVYRQISIASGSRLVFMAGQVSWDEQGNTVGEGDLTAQVEQCYLNVARALAGAGATFDHVAKLTIYAVDWTPDKLPALLDGIARASSKLGMTPVPPGSLIGVAALDTPDHLVEVEAIAVLEEAAP